MVSGLRPTASVHGLFLAYVFLTSKGKAEGIQLIILRKFQACIFQEYPELPARQPLSGGVIIHPFC